MAMNMRILIATLGNYFITTAITVFLARLLGVFMHPAEATLIVTFASFLIFAAIVVLVFAARRLVRMALGLGLVMLVSLAGFALLIILGGRA